MVPSDRKGEGVLYGLYFTNDIAMVLEMVPDSKGFPICKALKDACVVHVLISERNINLMTFAEEIGDSST